MTSVSSPAKTKTGQGAKSQQQRSQYLHPDYLEPPSGLSDPKQSPLALLVKTCDSIGRGGCSDGSTASSELADAKPHHPHPPGSRSASRRSNGGSSRPPSATMAAAFDAAAPLKRPASPACSREERLGQARPAKQQRSPPSPLALAPNLGKSPESPTGLSSSSSAAVAAAASLSPSSAAVAAAMAAAAAAAMPHHHPISGSPLPYPPVFPPFHHHHQHQQQHQHHYQQLAAAWGLGGVPDGHSAAVCACPHCVHARALVDYLYASAAAAAAAASVGSSATTAVPTASTSTSTIQHHHRQHSPTQPQQTPQAEFCIFCGRHCPTPEQLVRHMRSHEAASAIAPQISPFSGPPSPPLPPPPQTPLSASSHHATLAYAAAAAAAMQQQPQQLESMRKWAAAAAAATADQRYHPYRSLLGRLQFSHFGAAPLV